MYDVIDRITTDALSIAETIMLKDKIKKEITGMSNAFGRWNVFSEWIETCAISISNAVDKNNFEERERRYFQILDKYGPDNMRKFSEMFAWLVLYLDYVMHSDGPKDVLGEIFHEMDLHNEANGQFFTPNNVCRMMGAMVGGPNGVRPGRLFMIDEPAVGAGATILGIMHNFHQNNDLWQAWTYTEATDIDERCVHMAYLQFSLFGMQAKVIHGNTLTMEKWGEWITPLAAMNINTINFEKSRRRQYE